MDSMKRGEIQRGGCNLLCLTWPPERNARDHLAKAGYLFRCQAHLAGNWRVDRTGRDRIHSDTARSKLDCKRHSQSTQSCLAGAIPSRLSKCTKLHDLADQLV